ncbi:unnamed protein product [Closterium sp. Yama58-4]|nr:unnamed protein product [Closterium sp. Yama58-4]
MDILKYSPSFLVVLFQASCNPSEFFNVVTSLSFSSRSGKMASSRLSLLLPLLLVLAVSVAPLLSLHGSAFARSFEVIDGDIGSYLGTANNEGNSSAVAVPGAEEDGARRGLQEYVACGKNSIRFTTRPISDNLNGKYTYQLTIKNMCPEDIIGRLVFWNCDIGGMASSRRPLLLPLLLALAVSLAPSLSTQGSAFARSISASDVSDGDIDRFVNAGASNEEDSIAMAVPGAEEHVRRSLQSQKVSCDQNSILVTYRIISDQGNGTMVIQLIIKNLCPYDVIGRLIFWNCQMDTIYAAGNTNFQTGKLLFKAVAYIPPAGGLVAKCSFASRAIVTFLLLSAPLALRSRACPETPSCRPPRIFPPFPSPPRSPLPSRRPRAFLPAPAPSYSPVPSLLVAFVPTHPAPSSLPSHHPPRHPPFPPNAIPFPVALRSPSRPALPSRRPRYLSTLPVALAISPLSLSRSLSPPSPCRARYLPPLPVALAISPLSLSRSLSPPSPCRARCLPPSLVALAISPPFPVALATSTVISEQRAMCC